MKKRLALFSAIALLGTSTYAQQQKGPDREFIQIDGVAEFYELDQEQKILTDTVYHTDPGFRIYPHYQEKKIGNDVYVIVKYPDFNDIGRHCPATRLASALGAGINATHVDLVGQRSNGRTTALNGKTLAILKEEFDKLTTTDIHNNKVFKRGSYDFTSGVMTIPFKFRPRLDTTEFTMTTDITLGPYMGVTHRLSETKPYFLTLAGTLGVAFINLNDNTTSNENNESTTGIVPGLTWSTGLILQLDDFSLGYVLGQDFASEVGHDWMYHSRIWHSFAIGYNFLSKK
ncbi:MAG: hypothetical protein KDC12_14285 [Flavobacteriales bacterium]|nr:hypothetical protein [Flavobacteriales bacterium]